MCSFLGILHDFNKTIECSVLQYHFIQASELFTICGGIDKFMPCGSCALLLKSLSNYVESFL